MKERAPKAAPQNLLDKAIAYFAPRVAARRMQARMALGVAGGYTGARMDRASLAGWRTKAGSPDSDVIADLPKLRERSADLERNAPVATSVINTTATHVVGTGLACNPQIDAEFLGISEDEATAWQLDTRRRFKAWAESQDCDLARFLSFYGLQDLALRGVLGRGDIFCVTPRVTRGGRNKLALQMVEADRVCNPDNQPDTDTLTEGVEHSAETGEAVAYHFANRHPGDMARRGALKWTRVAARGNTGRRNVIHLFRQLRPGLRRGVPILAPVIEPIKQLGRYTEAELQAAVTSGLYSLFVTMDPQAFDDLYNDDSERKTLIEQRSKWSGEIEAGQAVNLLPGESVESSNPGRPNAQFDPFVQACVRQIGMAIGLPYEVLVMHYQSSYSAARGALLMAWKFFMGWRDWLATNMCQPVYELWLADEVAQGRISAPGFFTDEVVRHAWCGTQWVGDGPGSIDPAKEVMAAAERVALGISTLQAESLLHDGVDWETKHRQTVKESQKRRDAQLEVQGEAPPPPAPPAEPPPPNERDEKQADATLALTTGAMALVCRPPAPPPPELRHVEPLVKDVGELRVALEAQRDVTARLRHDVAALTSGQTGINDQLARLVELAERPAPPPPAAPVPPRAMAREIEYDKTGAITRYVDRPLND